MITQTNVVPSTLRDFNLRWFIRLILILKSSKHWRKVHRMRGKSIWGTVVKVTKGWYNSGQNKYHTITFFLEKSNFYRHFQRKYSFHFYISFKRAYLNCSLANSKRVASSYEKLYNEQWRIFCFYVTFCYDFLISHLSGCSYGGGLARLGGLTWVRSHILSETPMKSCAHTRSEPARLGRISFDFARIPPWWDENLPYE